MCAKIAEPPKGSLFTFKHFGCKCNIEKHYEDDGSESYWLQITSDKNREIELYHDFKTGLYKIDSEDIKQKDVIHELPLSYELKLLIKNFWEQEHTSGSKVVTHNQEEFAFETKNFFERFGFLFPILNKSILVSMQEVANFLNRIYIVSQLISELKNNTCSYRKSYNKILYYTFMLSLSEKKELKMIERSTNNTPVVHETPLHPLAKALGSHTSLKEAAYDYPHLLSKKLTFTTSSDKRFEIVESAMANYFASLGIELYTSHSSDSKEAVLLNNTVCFLVDDTFTNSVVPVICEIGSADSVSFKQNNLQYLELFPELSKQYLSLDKNAEEKPYIDFLVHFIEDFSGFLHLPNDFLPFIFNKKVDLTNNLSFDSAYQEKLIQFARKTIKNEVDAVLKNVLPSFDANEMAPAWYVPDLYTAIFYSLFLNAGNEKIEKSCANPMCYQTFSVEKSNSKHQYCSDSCSNSMRQRRYKETHPKIQPKNIAKAVNKA